MKEKRRITSDGYFEVSMDGGKTYVKTTQRPNAREIAEWKAYQVNTVKSTAPAASTTPTTKRGGIAEKVKATTSPDYFSMPTRQASMPEIKSPAAIDNTLEPKKSTSLKAVEEIGAEAIRKKRESDALANSKRYGAGLETLLGAAQAGYGLQQLMKDKRPVDVIDPTFSRLTDEAVAAARYGYTPEQKAALKSDIVNARIAQQARINQLAGGSAGVGLSNVRAALNEELMNKYKLEAQDEQLRREKMQLAIGTAGQRAGMSRALFADKMNEFMQKQQAGAELLGAGIQNVVGARRYQREREAQDQINKMMYGNTNLG